jgi:hypothetical protein
MIANANQRLMSPAMARNDGPTCKDSEAGRTCHLFEQICGMIGHPSISGHNLLP